MESLRSRIGGKPAASAAALIERREPGNSSSSLRPVAAASPADVSEACAAAAAAQRVWAATPLAERERALGKVAEALEMRPQLAEDLAREVGKPIAEAKGEVARAAAIFRYYAGTLRGAQGEVLEGPTPAMRVFTRRRPLGVVGLITPWNFPVAIPAWKLAPALAAGNGVVLKPATAAVGTALALAECCDEGGLPIGLVNVVAGRGSEIGDALLGDGRVQGVSFTGSVDVGRGVRVACAGRGIRVQTELGGRNPAIVLADADLPAAAGAVATGAFGYAGQKCTATRRVLVEETVADPFLDVLLEKTAALRNGDPLDPSTAVGPLIDTASADDTVAAIRQATDAGARLLIGGGRGDGALAGGAFVEPTILAGVPGGVRLGCEEVFGPVLVWEVVPDLDTALTAANDTTYGLSAGVHTTSLAAAARFEREIEAGVIVVNRPTTGVEPHAPFGGVKASGYGWREQGAVALSFYSELQAVYEA